MRLLNSICKLLASRYTGVPVHIEEVPNDFKRECFLVTLATGSSKLRSYNVYEDVPLFQIVYFGKRNEANQVIAEELYRVKEELRALLMLCRAVPVIPIEGLEEKKPRYAKIETYSDEIRLSEGAVYVKLSLNFTDDVPKIDNHDPIGDVEFVLKRPNK